MSETTSPQWDWLVGYHIVTHHLWCFDKPAWPLCCTITWSQLVRSKVNANGWCSRGSSFMSECECGCMRVCFCGGVLKLNCHKKKKKLWGFPVVWQLVWYTAPCEKSRCGLFKWFSLLWKWFCVMFRILTQVYGLHVQHTCVIYIFDMSVYFSVWLKK